jgi:hypothetical protein
MDKNEDRQGSSERTPATGPAKFGRRSAIKSTLMAAGAAAFMPERLMGTARRTMETPARPLRQYNMKKSINLWAFPFPERMTLEQCLRLAKDAGFDGIELNYDLETELSPRSGTSEFTEIRRMAEDIGIEISGLCSFLFWPYPLTDNDPQKRERGIELASNMARAAHDLGTENLLVVPGAVHILVENTTSGEVTGTTRNQLWLHPQTALVLREIRYLSTSNPSPFGRVNYVEETRFELTSLTPRT